MRVWGVGIVMMLAACFTPAFPVARFAGPGWQKCPNAWLKNAWLKIRRMTVSNDGKRETTPPGPADWAAMIGAMAQAQDRAAFARLFQYFAPRVKSFMRRSGMSDQAAEELAQETLLAVWRKAATFDPASTGPSAWIFTIARNLRIDALRRERRGIAAVTNDIALEFALDEAPAADAVLAANQKSVEEFRAGKEKAFNALVGQAMKATQGKGNPTQVNELLKKKLAG